MTVEAIESVNPYTVKGQAANTRGPLELGVGDLVSVMWQIGQPPMILDVRTRKGAGTDEPFGGGPVVEELFIAPRPGDAVLDVWFRNFDQCRPLRIPELVPGIGGPSTVKWGPANKHFLLRASGDPEAGGGFYVFEFQREPFKPFKKGGNAQVKVRLKRRYVLSEITFPVATLSPSGIPDGALTVTVANTFQTVRHGSPSGINVAGTLTVQDALLDTNGDLVLAYALDVTGIGLTVSGGSTTFCGLGTPQPILQAVSFRFIYPVVVNAATGAILFDGFTNGIVGQYTPLPGSSLVFNSLNILAIGGSWTLIQESLNPDPLDPCFGQVNAQVWCFKFGFNIRFHYMAPLYAQGAKGALPARTSGFIGLLQQLTDAPPEERRKIGPGIDPGMACPPTAVTGGGAIGRGINSGVNAVMIPFELTPTQLAIRFEATYDRVVWARATTGSMTPSFRTAVPVVAPAFITRYATNVTTALSASGEVKIGDRGMEILPTDFAYQLDNPPVALPTDTRTKYFVKLWPFGKATGAPPNIDGGQYPEDVNLKKFKALKDIPVGVAQPTNFESFSLQIVNDPDALLAAGRYKRIPRLT